VRKFAALLLLAASCAAEKPKDSQIARKAFEDWAKSAVSGDAEKTLAGFSDARKSEWLFDRFVENHLIVRKWRGELTGEARTHLDLWLGVSKRNGNGRDAPLQPIVLDHPSFAPMFREFFLLTAQGIKDSLSKLEIAQVYGDDSGVTVAVRAGPGAPTELYGLIFESGRWKIDTYRQPLNGGR
jgi:hypothetical protein